MQIQPINNKPSYTGKVHCLCNGGLSRSKFIEERIQNELPQLDQLMKDKPYNLYITPNLMKTILFNVTPGESFEPIFNGERYRINVPYNHPKAIVAAAKEAIKIYEEGKDIPLIKYPPPKIDLTT